MLYLPDTDKHHVRPATPYDASAIAQVHVTSSQASYAPLSPRWQGAALADQADLWSSTLATYRPGEALFVAEGVGARILGFAHGGPGWRQDAPATLDLYTIHVLPTSRGCGVGSRLWQAACNQLRGTNRRALYLETFAELPCCRFYEARGGTVAKSHPRHYWGTAVTDILYLWPNGNPHHYGASAPA